MLFLVLCLILSLGKNGAVPLIQSRIIGGWKCEKQSQPWQVAVSSQGFAMCGGVLVHPQWVLTAAHCIRKNSQVWLGGHNLFDHEDTAQSIQVRCSFPHPLYDMSLLKNRKPSSHKDSSHDLMFLHLSEPANITDTVRVLDLPPEEPELGSCRFASGWGSIHPHEVLFPRTLQCVDLNLMSNDVCEKAYSEKVTEFMLCAGRWKGGKDTCGGDSGGPLICNGMLQGLTSWGSNPCALPRQPALYTKLTRYRKWIEDTMVANP
uniref:Kallikrein-2-like isoform X1 n=1 Tax=Castor canadensis TaxID=51338 RepID=A0A8B7U7T3_CASCN|nr:kallikrein-2-like isoform X1 [Castor canadensis]